MQKNSFTSVAAVVVGARRVYFQELSELVCNWDFA